MKLKFLTLIFVLIHVSSFAQALKGIVVDEDQNPIEYVSILDKTNSRHTYTDARGMFVFESVAVGDTLHFFHFSYKSIDLVILDLDRSLEVELEADAINLSEVVVSPSINALHVIADIDVFTNPVNSSQDVLRKVPGLFIGQHAGGGKAEQLFLRGFDIDHGTDVNVTIDGLPVNMVSHAHGQGYADLHFVIPETIDKVDFGKGPYYESEGNFNTAGYVRFSTKQKLENSSIKLETGQFATYRLLGMLNLIESNKQNAYVATEFLSSDGYFDSPQNFNRINLFGKYTYRINKQDKLAITASLFDSKWDASGQIPQRAIDRGLISRFGSIDDTEGGATFRKNFIVSYDKIIDKNSSIKSKVYLSHYDFELYSNFTFFLEDPINGDQIRQKEDRNMYGFSSVYTTTFSTGNIGGSWRAGISLRNDQTKDTELSRTKNRIETLEQNNLGDINETNVAAYIATTIDIDKWVFNPSIRFDYFDFQYYDKLLPTYQIQEANKVVGSPNLNILYNPSRALQLYLKMGKGFHSNDTRVVVAREGQEILPAAYGFDLGYIWKPIPQILFNMAYWYLYLEQEFVYVGDAGIVEPSGKTRRQGFDVSCRYQPIPWFYGNIDANYAYARAVDELPGDDFIPLAPDFTLVGGFNFSFKSGLYASINLRHIGNRPANEDNSIVADGYTITDMNTGYKWGAMNVGIQIQNLFNTEWNETQFATETRLQFEQEPVEEIHITPGTPFFIKAMVQYNF